MKSEVWSVKLQFWLFRLVTNIKKSQRNLRKMEHVLVISIRMVRLVWSPKIWNRLKLKNSYAEYFGFCESKTDWSILKAAQLIWPTKIQNCVSHSGTLELAFWILKIRFRICNQQPKNLCTVIGAILRCLPAKLNSLFRRFNYTG